MSPCDQVKGLQRCPNFLLFIPQRDARTAARMRMYIAKLVCCVFGPVRSIDGPASAPANSALHPAVLNRPEKLYSLAFGKRKTNQNMLELQIEHFSFHWSIRHHT